MAKKPRRPPPKSPPPVATVVPPLPLAIVPPSPKPESPLSEAPTYLNPPSFEDLYATSLPPPIPQPKRTYFTPPPTPSTDTAAVFPCKPPPPTLGSPNPVYTHSQRQEIANATADTVSPTAAFTLLNATNTTNRNLQVYTTETYIIDCRNQDEIRWQVVDGIANTLIRGAVLFSQDRMEKLRGVEEGKRQDMLPEPMCEDEMCWFKTILISCTDGGKSMLVADLMLEIGFANVTVISGGIRAWKRERLPVMVVGGNVDVSDDEGSDGDEEIEKPVIEDVVVASEPDGRPPRPPKTKKEARGGATDVSSDEGSGNEGTDAIDKLFSKGLNIAMSTSKINSS